MCGGQTATISSGAAPLDETRQERIARIVKFKKDNGFWGEESPTTTPTLSDTVVTEAAQSAALRARQGRGRRSTMLAAGSIGDSSSLLGY